MSNKLRDEAQLIKNFLIFLSKWSSLEVHHQIVLGESGTNFRPHLAREFRGEIIQKLFFFFNLKKLISPI